MIAGLLLALLLLPVAALGQDLTVRRAAAAYDGLAYEEAIADAHRALKNRLTAADQARAFEVLGFAYAALDSTVQATDAFKELLLLNPDRDLDPTRISPKITSLFALALGQVLVIRHFHVDTGSFIAGTGDVALDFTVSRTARVRAHIEGPSGAVTVDSTMREGETRVRWTGLVGPGRAAESGAYRLVVEATAGRDSYAAAYPLRIVAGLVDTIPLLTSLPGYALQPEMVVPPRSVRPVALAALAAGVVAGTTLALENRSLNAGSRTPLFAISGGAVLTGLLATIKRPALVPSAANIRYNTLVRDQLARRNAEIHTDNAKRRTEVRLTVMSDVTTEAVR
jgi:hypothetical protein